jgi:hypothetical protein
MECANCGRPLDGETYPGTSCEVCGAVCDHGYTEGCPDCDVASYLPAVLPPGDRRRTEIVEDE